MLMGEERRYVATLPEDIDKGDAIRDIEDAGGLDVKPHRIDHAVYFSAPNALVAEEIAGLPVVDFCEEAQEGEEDSVEQDDGAGNDGRGIPAGLTRRE
jgi:hypothetical protein